MGTSESWSGEREDLAAEALRRSGRLRLQVRGESMLPALWPGDVAEIADCSLDDVACGEIVLAFRGGRFYLHRLLARVGEGGFITRGDSMPRCDVPYESGAFLGKLVRVVREGHAVSVPLENRPRYRAFGLLFCYSSAARRLALKLHRWNRRRGSAATSERCGFETP